MSDPYDPRQDPEPIHSWFSLSYASWLVVPRLVMQSMPQEWQARMVELLSEMNETFEWSPEGAWFCVMEQVGDADPDENDDEADERLRRPDFSLCDYRHGNVEHIRKKP